jgi:hypothetical protein
MARPRKEVESTDLIQEQFEQAQGEVNAEFAPAPTTDPTKAKKYHRYTLEVEAFLSKKGGTKSLDRFEGRFVEVAKKKGMTSENIVMESHRIARMNSKWHTTKFYYLEVGANVPDHIVRTPNGDTELNGGWDDKFVF